LVKHLIIKHSIIITHSIIESLNYYYFITTKYFQSFIITELIIKHKKIKYELLGDYLLFIVELKVLYLLITLFILINYKVHAIIIITVTIIINYIVTYISFGDLNAIIAYCVFINSCYISFISMVSIIINFMVNLSNCYYLDNLN
jgi:hypothetical protein